MAGEVYGRRFHVDWPHRRFRSNVAVMARLAAFLLFLVFPLLLVGDASIDGFAAEDSEPAVCAADIAFSGADLGTPDTLEEFDDGASVPAALTSYFRISARHPANTGRMLPSGFVLAMFKPPPGV